VVKKKSKVLKKTHTQTSVLSFLKGKLGVCVFSFYCSPSYCVVFFFKWDQSERNRSSGAQCSPGDSS